jgi:hypothetical protein
VPRLAGPLDLWTPAFAARRPQVRQAIAEVRAGDAVRLVATADALWRGTRLSGASWSLSPELLAEVAGALPPEALAMALERLADQGDAARGLPDLVVLPGPETRIPNCFPSRIPPGLLLAEVKGPGDQLRAEQRVWADRLLAAGAHVEWWFVAPPP